MARIQHAALAATKLLPYLCSCLTSYLPALQALILIKLFPESLLSVAIFGVLDNIARLACGSVIGQFVDRYVVCGPGLTAATSRHTCSRSEACDRMPGISHS
jgi:hypothetical protein